MVSESVPDINLKNLVTADISELHAVLWLSEYNIVSYYDILIITGFWIFWCEKLLLKAVGKPVARVHNNKEM